MTFEEFENQASTATMIPLRRELFADLLTPVSAYMMLRSPESPSFLLETVEQHEAIGRYSFVGLDPLMLVTARGRRLTIVEGGRHEEREGDLFALLRDLTGEFRLPAGSRDEGFIGGFVGYIGYDAVQYLEHVPLPPRLHDDEPDAVLGLFATVVRFDHRFHRATLLHHVVLTPGLPLRRQYEDGIKKLDTVQLRLRSLPVAGQFTWSPPENDPGERESFLRNVSEAKRHITEGDIFQVVLSRRVTAPYSGDPFVVYRALRMLNPSPYLFYLEFGETRLIGSSPEVLVRVREGVVDALPIAGTRPRGETVEADRAFELSLLGDEKERAEHLMLVDLGRNDVGRVSAYGSVQVPVFGRVERYSHVMHMVSQVRAQLREGLTSIDALCACFPAGTVSGAPKVRAMEIITELESTRRGVYAGAVGYLGLDGSLDTCIAIRTIVAHRDRLRMQAGAGIVADSDPEREYQETVSKMQVLLDAARLAADGLAPPARNPNNPLIH